MKKLFAFVLIHSWYLSYSQNMTNVWELSYSTNISYPNCEMRYAAGSMDTNSIYRIMSFHSTNTSICDTDGNLLFYSNGLTIGNRNYDTLQNAVNFNPGFATDFYEPGGMSIDQAVLILPWPDEVNKYFIFSISSELLQYDIQPLQLRYSVIDMNLNGGLGGIIDSLKTKSAIEDTLANGALTAVKHANGRDWWLIVPRYKLGFYKLLITPNGINEILFQNIGSVVTNDVVADAQFSPDGSKYCLSNEGGTFDFMEFDRCTGELYNCKTAHSGDSLGFRGCCFSPNSRFLYLTTAINLYQYDSWDTNMINSAIHVATWDSFVDPIFHNPVLFATEQLAPDNKIYMSPWNGVEYFNVINFPDSLGTACNFAPHSYVMPQYNDGIPNFPNYDLGALVGSVCDTLYLATSSGSPPKISLRMYPNPAVNWLNILYQTNEDALFELFDLYGKQVAVGSLFHYFRNRLFNVSDLPDGIYVANVTQKRKIVWSQKIIVVH